MYIWNTDTPLIFQKQHNGVILIVLR